MHGLMDGALALATLLAFVTLTERDVLRRWDASLIRFARALSARLARLDRTEVRGAITAVAITGGMVAFMAATLAEIRTPRTITISDRASVVAPIEAIDFAWPHADIATVDLKVGTVEVLGDRHCRVPITVVAAAE